MAYDEGVAKRIRGLFLGRAGMTERKMFGRLAFMYRSHMLVGIIGASLMARIGPAEYEQTLKRPHVRKMDFTGKPMKGHVHVDPAGFESDSDPGKWVDLCIRFNASLPQQPEHHPAPVSIIERSKNHDSYPLPFGLSLSKPCAHLDMPFDGLRANGDVVMIYGNISKGKQTLDADRFETYRQEPGIVHLADHCEHEVLEGEDGREAVGHFFDLDAGCAENDRRPLPFLRVDFQRQRGEADFRPRAGLGSIPGNHRADES